MKYTNQLPSPNKFRWLARLVGPFPASAKRINGYARHFGFDKDVISFLHQFHPDEIFESRADFLNRCEDLAFMIAQERSMPDEILRSPQG
jgi:hypothetical protein